MHRLVKDLLTTRVAAVGPATPFKEREKAAASVARDLVTVAVRDADRVLAFHMFDP
jgi:hypothetical protein